MELNRQWCDNLRCPDFRQVGTNNLHVFSYVDRRYYCTTCRQTWNADKGTAFETLRRPRLEVVETVAELGERVSLRATGRLKHHPVNTVLDWLAVTGEHTAAVSGQLIRDLHVAHAQVDELWTFVKKTRAPSTQRPRRLRGYLGLAGYRAAQSLASGQPSEP